MAAYNDPTAYLKFCTSKAIYSINNLYDALIGFANSNDSEDVYVEIAKSDLEAIGVCKELLHHPAHALCSILAQVANQHARPHRLDELSNTEVPPMVMEQTSHAEAGTVLIVCYTYRGNVIIEKRTARVDEVMGEV